MTGAALLPSNATVWERAVSLTSATRRPLDSDIIRRVWSPWACPAEFLPYLAHAFSVDLWDEAWPETRKRSIIANAVEMHRLKGTLAGIERYLAYVDVTVRKAATPPAKVFSGPSLTKAQREAWLSGLPQVRVWRLFERSTRSRRLFAGGGLFASFLETGVPQPNDAVLRTARRARWVVNGTETDTRVVSFESYFQLFVKALRPLVVFCNLTVRRRFFQPSTAASRIVTIAPVSLSPWRTPAIPSLQPVTSEPELVAQPGARGRSVYDGPIRRPSYFVPSTAPIRLFQRYAVNDGSLGARGGPAIQFMGVGRYGMPAHTAELSVLLRAQRSRFAAGEGIAMPRLRFWLPHDPRPLRKTREAVIVAKRRTDAILLDTTTPSGFIAGQILLAGGTFRA